MRVKIKFHGLLKKLCPKIYEIEANSPVEAIRGLTNQLPQLRKRADGSLFSVIVKECQTKELLFSKSFQSEELNLYPSFVAAGGGLKGLGIAQIVVGSLMVAAGVVVGAIAGWTGVGAVFAVGLMSVGLGVMLGGIGMMLMPTPNVPNTSGKDDGSKYFSAKENTTTIGTRIAVAYGLNKLYGQLLSFNLQASNAGDTSSVPQAESGVLPHVGRFVGKTLM